MWARQQYFFDQGLRFECRQCGDCCTGAPGTIYVAPDEIGRISDYLHCPADTTIEQFLYPYKDSFSIREDSFGNCLFYKGKCDIYPVRPFQCRSFPFWFNNVRSLEHWKAAGRLCPGIGRGHLFTREEIIRLAQMTIML